MVRKLLDSGAGNGYTATGLVLVDWDEAGRVHVLEAEVPDDVAAPQFFRAIIASALAAAPVTHHVVVRERMERRHIPVQEGDSTAEN